eukprot:CAMPEP_0197871124 /NCGR_PEP_ID=MMETSP1439-20131203/1632_1 /TAXON_ID=66791 /ORGANISM="Gonyaulax spinifera, Strain CCMP409" /LENGTH=796 /DNA_ID=CAMNT_0043490053 /DNA_START=148 /DNA_END=2536 /DNA_ORIENTATION=+
MSIASASELLSFVWVEAAMFSCAALVYMAYSGGLSSVRAADSPRAGKEGKQQPRSEKTDVTSVADNVVALDLLKKLRQGRLSEASTMLSKLTSGELDTVLDAVAPRLLTAAAKANPSEAEACLRSVAAGIKPHMVEATLSEAVRRKDIKACLELGRLMELLQIARSPRCLELLEKAERLEQDASLRSSSSEEESSEKTDKVNVSVVREKIRNCGRAGDLPGAVEAFQQTSIGNGKAGAILHNSIIEACVECKDFSAATNFLAKAQALGIADAASFSMVIRGLLSMNEEAAARQLLKEASKLGAQACQSSYHSLLHARVVAGDRHGAMQLMEEMRPHGVMPNAVSCSILLKMVVAPAQSVDLLRIIKLLETQDIPMDEVLLSSIVEASLKAGRLDQLAKVLERNRAQPGGGLALTAPTYGSMIKAFGQAREVVRMWAVWQEMVTRGVQPTAITLGCMVEALVANRRTEEAFELVYEAWGDDKRAHLVNTVTCSTLLKGLAKNPEKVLEVYDEMRARGVECNTIAYNTILNVFAQSRAMHHVPRILEDMKNVTPPVEPDVVTYSTLIKGFCASGGLDRALGLLTAMQKEGKYQADEMMYNSLLDGCAKEQRLQDALRLVGEMRETGVTPSNYTLSMLIKLLGRCRRIDQAFSMVESISSEFGFRPNIQVYTCLIQACFYNRQPGRAASLFTRILEEGVRADEKLFTVVVRGHLQMGQVDKAASWACRAYEGRQPVGVETQCIDEVVHRLGSGSPLAKSLFASMEAADGSPQLGVEAEAMLGAARADQGLQGDHGCLCQ